MCWYRFNWLLGLDFVGFLRLYHQALVCQSAALFDYLWNTSRLCLVSLLEPSRTQDILLGLQRRLSQQDRDHRTDFGGRRQRMYRLVQRRQWRFKGEHLVKSISWVCALTSALDCCTWRCLRLDSNIELQYQQMGKLHYKPLTSFFLPLILFILVVCALHRISPSAASVRVQPWSPQFSACETAARQVSLLIAGSGCICSQRPNHHVCWFSSFHPYQLSRWWFG